MSSRTELRGQWWPASSEEAREQRELELERATVAEQLRRRHDEACRAGWLGEDLDGRPIACPRCRPHLAAVACRTCQRPATWCGAGSPCCPTCDHDPVPPHLRDTTPERTPVP